MAEGQLKEPKHFTILHARRDIHQSKKNLLELSAISISPFHHGETRFQAIEEKKWRFLRDFLFRRDHISLDLCIPEVKLLEERTRRCYSETVDLDSHVFVEMMPLDGCFVLEYLKENQCRWSNSIFKFGLNSGSVFTDLLVLDNQIAFFVVEKLYGIGVKEDKNYFVNGPRTNRLPPNGEPSNRNSSLGPSLSLLFSATLVNFPIKPVVLRSKSLNLTKELNSNRIKDFTSQSSSLAFQILPEIHRYS